MNAVIDDINKWEWLYSNTITKTWFLVSPDSFLYKRYWELDLTHTL